MYKSELASRFKKKIKMYIVGKNKEDQRIYMTLNEDTF